MIGYSMMMNDWPLFGVSHFLPLLHLQLERMDLFFASLRIISFVCLLLFFICFVLKDVTFSITMLTCGFPLVMGTFIIPFTI